MDVALNKYTSKELNLLKQFYGIKNGSTQELQKRILRNARSGNLEGDQFMNKTYPEILGLLETSTLNGMELLNTNFIGISIDNEEIFGVNFTSSIMHHAKFDQTEFTNCIFNFVNLESINADTCLFNECEFTSTIMNGANFTGSDIINSRLESVSGESANFTRGNLSEVQVLFSSFPSAFFVGTNIQADFYDISFVNADFTEVNMYQCKFAKCDFTNCNFRHARMHYVEFKKCVFRNADLSRILEFGHINLDQSDLTLALLPNVDYSGVSLRETITNGARIIFIDPATGDTGYTYLQDVLNTIYGPRILPPFNSIADVHTALNNHLLTQREAGKIIKDLSVTVQIPQPPTVTMNVHTECDNQIDYISTEQWSDEFMPNLYITYITPGSRNVIYCAIKDDVLQWLNLPSSEMRGWYPNEFTQQMNNEVDVAGFGSKASTVETFYMLPDNHLVANSKESLLDLINGNNRLEAYQIYTSKIFGNKDSEFTISGSHGQKDSAKPVYMLVEENGDINGVLQEYVTRVFDMKSVLLDEGVTTENVKILLDSVAPIIPLPDLAPNATVTCRIDSDNMVTCTSNPEKLIDKVLIVNDVESDFPDYRDDQIVLINFNGGIEIGHKPDNVDVEILHDERMTQ